ncbi:histidine--tRNA ligase [Candidatus Nanohalococcus occultus]|uniref:histidine--tRNA ligase n=1 Tax=Candidatus Nanohalococcus occultus TaxID=2978047 RepID=UPI0039E100D5
MTDEIKGLKGFYDRYPEDWASWRKLIDTVENTAKEFGFREINAPSVEKADLYRVKSGEELMDQMYNFEDKGGREISLIPEQTPTRARLVQQRKDLKSPIKWFDTSKRWRYENVQRGRDREFFQTDFDVFGVDSVEADAEVIAAGATIYKKLDLDDRVNFLVNDRNLLESILEAHGIEKTEEAMKVIDDKEKMSSEEFLEELTDVGLGGDQAEQVDEITSISGQINEQISQLREQAPEDAQEAVDRMEALSETLEAYGVAEMVELDLSIVRGLAYYTGLVFEAFDSEGELRALFGGGRYDDLVGLFGGQDVPAVGFAFGYSTTIELLKKEDRWPLKEVETEVYVLTVSDSVKDKGMEYAKDLREKGLTVETDLSSRGFGSQLEYADSINAKRVLIVGERDLENDEVTIKHMDSGDEENIGKDEVVGKLTE